MEFRMLGPLEVVSDGQSLGLGGAKQRCLLAVLLLNANEVVSNDRLIDALWEDDPPESALKALQVHVSSLRKVLGKDRLVTRGSGYLLRVEDDELDLARFEHLHDQGRVAEALSLWRGQPLSDFGSRRFAQPEIARLEDVRLACLEQRIDHDLAAGRHSELTGELERLVQEHPLRERLRAQLMLALYRSGRQADALAVYQGGRHALVDELGIEPGRELRELQQTILRQDPALELGREPHRDTAVPAGTGFVGRERELAELASGLDDAFAGRGRLFLLQGEPGIGKSRLADELMSRAKARGATVVAGRCWEAGGAPAYWPWTQSLRAYVRQADEGVVRRQLGPGAGEVAQIVPELRELFPGLSQPEPSEPEAARFRLFDATATFLADVSADRPLVLAFDDLHAADEPSLLLLRYVASTMDGARILILGTFRDVDPTVQDSLDSTLADLGREPVTRRLRLAGLTQPEVASLAELTAHAAPSKELVAELYAETEGNPLFVSEIVRLLAAEGRLDAARAGAMPVPETIREVIGRRLRRLSGECRRVLSIASLFGREFGLVALERVADYTGIDKLLAVLDEAIVARVVEEVPGGLGRLRFGHALTRDTLYEEIPATHRARLHRRVAEVLETLYAANPEPHLAELAHHFSLAVPAAPAEKAIEYAKRAGDRAVVLLAYEEGARLYELALNVSRSFASTDDRRRCELLLLLGEAESAGNRLAAQRAFLAAAELARRHGLPRELARAAAGYGGWIMYARAGADHRLVPLLEEGLEALADDDVELRSRLLARLSGALRDEPARERRDRLSLEAVELARRAQDPIALTYALDGRAAAIIAPDTLAECLALASELRDTGARIGNTERMVQGHWHRVITEVMIGHIDEAEADVEAIERLVPRLGRAVQRWQVAAARAMLAFAAGRIAEGEAHAVSAFELGERAQPEMAIPIYRLQQFTLHELRGSLEAVASELRQLVDDYPARPFFRCVPVYVDAVVGRTAEARRGLRDLVLDDCSALPFDMEWLYGMSLLAETSHLLADTESASILYRLLEWWGELNVANGPEGVRGPVGRYLGLLGATMERWGDSERHFDHAIRMNQRMGARPWLALTQEDYGRMLLRRGDGGDAERAEPLLAQALSTYEELGMQRSARIT